METQRQCRVWIHVGTGFTGTIQTVWCKCNYSQFGCLLCLPCTMTLKCLWFNSGWGVVTRLNPLYPSPMIYSLYKVYCQIRALKTVNTARRGPSYDALNLSDTCSHMLHKCVVCKQFHTSTCRGAVAFLSQLLLNYVANPCLISVDPQWAGGWTMNP